jgi:hypothetical protein
MNHIRAIGGMAVLVILLGCEKYWEEHYGTQPETVNENVWDAIQRQSELSTFVHYMKEFSYDTLFLTNDSYTLFIPDNDAFEVLLDTGEVTLSILDYHISQHFIQSGSIQGTRKVQTLAEKFAVFEHTANSSLFDGIPLQFESPLYLNGKYFTMDRVAEPKPNLYEFFEVHNPVLKDYIDEQDSIVLDKEKSRPKGFDSLGNTIYDTVSTIYNKFEAEYFPVSKEFRNKTATIVFPLKDDYEAALTEMAEKLGGSFIDYNDIPLEWQYDVLIPHLLEHGVFENQMEEYEFMFRPGKDSIKLKNILGDSIVVTYAPTGKALCSNGYAYNYADFTVPDSLYIGSSRFEGEWLLKTTGLGKYTWKEEVIVKSDLPFEVKKEYIPTASNDSVMNIAFTKGYTGKYSLEFKTETMFPGLYHMVVRTHMDVGGIYDIYVNDVLVLEDFDYYDYVVNRGIYWSCEGGRFLPEGRFNRFDACNVAIEDFGRVKIRFEYKGPGQVAGNGLVIDYIEFTPEAKK